jgi:integrase
MAGVAKDPRDGRWLARWRDPGGKQRKKSFDRKVDAQRWLDQMRADAHRGQYIDPRAGTVRVGDLARTWAGGLSHLKESTAATYRGIVKVHILPAFGTRQLDEVRRSDVQAWVEGMSKNGKAPGTVRQSHRALSLILDTAVDDGRIARNPAHGVKLPRQRRAEPRFLDVDEVRRLVSVAGNQGPALSILALCGLRFGGLAALRVRDVDPVRRRLTIAGSVTEVGGRLVRSAPKTGRTRSVPYPPSLGPMLDTLTKGRHLDEQLVTAPEGGPLRLRNWRARVFDPAARAIGRTDITPHDLRHTAASLAIKAGANVKAVQQMLGHASAAMTLDVYAGLFRNDLDSVAEALDVLMIGAQLEVPTPEHHPSAGVGVTHQPKPQSPVVDGPSRG